MERLTDIEREQVKPAELSTLTSVPSRWSKHSLAEYLAFLAFMARFTPPVKPRLITEGNDWKL